MGVTTTQTNKPFNPRGNDQSPKGYNRAKLYSGKALDFDGFNDNIAIHDATDLWTGDFSVSWYGNLDATGNYFAFSSGTYTGSGQAGINVWYGGASNTNFSAHFPESDGTGQQGYNLTLAESYEYWHRIDLVFVSSSRLLSLYQNGILVDTSTIASNVDAAYMPNGWEFGRSYGGSFPLNGKLTNLKAFNTALTAAQVADLYNNPEKVVPTGVDNTALKLWLPMMEGAGTTAYDGSGNGNHGTISGATYVNGIGAPVAQSAVMDWNKGTNLLSYSEDFSQYPTGGDLVKQSGFLAPDGTNNAYKVSSASGNGSIYSIGSGANYYRSIWARTTSGTGTADLLSYFENTNNTFTITEEWQRFEVSSTDSAGGASNFYAVDFRGGGTLNEVVIWGGQTKADSSSGPYVRTNGTAQTTPVLLPQGLTTGRDITGVNLFENVRKQGALNLDGNSWAEVHDNASLDITSAITLEAWVYWQGDNNDDGILGRYGTTTAERDCTLYAYAGGIQFYVTSNAVSYTSMTNGWRHIVGTYDGANKRLYVDGVQVNSSAETSTMPGGSIPIDIGRYGQDASKTYTQPIAQPRIYNRALTAEEVQRNYNAGKNTYTN